MKIVNPDIYVKEEGTRDTQRLWIDIFPFDGMGKSVFRIKLLNTTVRLILKNCFGLQIQNITRAILEIVDI